MLLGNFVFLILQCVLSHIFRRCNCVLFPFAHYRHRAAARLWVWAWMRACVCMRVCMCVHVPHPFLFHQRLKTSIFADFWTLWRLTFLLTRLAVQMLWILFLICFRCSSTALNYQDGDYQFFIFCEKICWSVRPWLVFRCAVASL